MAFELRELQGNIFRNRYKDSDKKPDLKGEMLLNGVPHEIAIWEKEGQNGTFWGFKISEKRKKADPISTGPRNDDMNDDIPF